MANILFSFDVEEFDIPIEYGCQIEMPEQMAVGKQGLDRIMPIVAHVPSTMFVTANFAQQYPEAIQQLAATHEIASHTFYHIEFKEEDLLSSRRVLSEISGQKVVGLRMPRMQKVSTSAVKAAGYTYDSSIHPTWLPGRYNNLNLPKTVYTENGLTRLPATVSPTFRLPLFWLAFKNYPYWLFLYLVKRSLKTYGYVCLYFHPWEFVPIHKYNLPGYVKKGCDNLLVERLEKLIVDLKPYGEFTTIKQYLQSTGAIAS
jgi:Polysaccharide deacetylase